MPVSPRQTKLRRTTGQDSQSAVEAPVPASVASDATTPRPTLPACVAVDPLDPAGLGPLPQVPLLPEALRRKHKVFVEADARFRANARFLQALWREDRGIPIGVHEDQRGRRCALGSRISAAAGRAGTNFIDPAILPVVNRELTYREVGAVYELDRLSTNLLSSQPLVFNACATLKLDLVLATRVLAELLPGYLREVTEVLFEHSPGRGDPRFTQDGTAFDLALRGRSDTGEGVTVYWEWKYSESCQEPVPRFSGRFDAIAPGAGLFVDPANPRLRSNPVQQFFRQHCLAATTLDQGLTDRAVLVLVAPRLNHTVWAAASAYASQLLDPVGGRVPFVPVTLERFFGALAAAGAVTQAQALHRRYTDFWLVDGELQLDAGPSEAGAIFSAESPVRRRQARRRSPVQDAT